MITHCALAVTGRTRYASVEKGCRKFSKKNIDNAQRFNTDSGILARRGVQKLRVFLGISTHPQHLPRNVKTPNDSRTYEAPTEVPYPLFSQAQKCCVLFFVFFSTFIFQRKHEMLPALWPNEGRNLPSHSVAS